MLHQCIKNFKALFYGILKILIFCLLTKKNSLEEGLLENSYLKINSVRTNNKISKLFTGIY